FDVGRRDVPDQPARSRVPAVDLGVPADRDEARADRPAAVALVGHRRLAEELRVVVDQCLRVVRPDEDVVEIHGTPPVRYSLRGRCESCFEGTDMGTGVKGIDAITLFVEDLPAAKAFYIEIFGLPLRFEDPNSAVFMIGATELNLLVV